MGRKIANLLPQVSFSILLALSLRPRHGYEIMQQVEHDSGGKVRLGPGALYGAVKQLRGDGLIEEILGDNPKERRRYYRLTPKGWDSLNAELERMESTVRLARERKLLGDAIWVR